MIVFSGFDGMSCGQIALNKAGYKIDKYYSAEIDKFAIQVTQANFPDTIQMGDITKWKEWDIDWATINLLIGGSPCQGFSFAGKQLNFSDPRSKLFFIWVDILNHIKKVNPDVLFLLENVNMKREYMRIISEYLGVFPVRINSRLVSAQNRDRWYWSNIRTKDVGLFAEGWTDIPQPEDKGILLKDILQPEELIDQKYYLSNTALKRIIRKEYSKPAINPDKTGTLNTKNNSGQLSVDSGTTLIGLDINGKAPTQRSSTGRSLDKKHNYQIIPVLNDKGKLIKTDKANCIDANYFKGMDNHAQRSMILTHSLQPRQGKGQGGKGHLMEDDNKSYCMDTTNNQAIEYSGKLRRLTPIECERLQTVPDNYTNHVSDSQRYKMLGNGWTVDIITHIFKHIRQGGRT